MSEQNYTPSEVGVEVDNSFVEKLSPHQTIETVSKDLSEKLSPQRKIELESATQTAIRFAEKFGIKPEMLDVSAPQNREKVIQLLLIGNEWQKATTFSSQTRVMNIFRKIYEPSDRDRNIVGLDNTESYSNGITDEFVSEMIKIIWPESNGDYHWVMSNVVKDDIAMIPIKRGSLVGTNASEIQSQAIKNIGGDPRKIIKFRALTSIRQDSKMILAFEGIGKTTLAHERLHLNNPGLVVGGLGHTLNEGVTELLAEEETNQSKNILDVITKSYPAETSMLRSLFKKSPELRNICESKYRNNTIDNQNLWYQSLIEKYGLSNTLAIYRSTPSGSRLSQEQRKILGVETSQSASKILLHSPR